MNKITIQQLINQVVKFRDDREWQQFTNLKDSAIAVSLESAELLEHFKWKTAEEIAHYVKKHKNEIEEEVMDVLFNILLIAQQLDINVDEAFFKKMKKNEEKYPIEKTKGVNPHL